MQYFGGKFFIAKKLAELLNSNADGTSYYLEPFIGACNVAPLVKHDEVLASDINKYLIAMFQALQSGWTPPLSLSKEEYVHIRENKDENPPLTAFAGFACSFAGKWFGGYAKNHIEGEEGIYATHGRNSLLRLAPTIANVKFSCTNYSLWEPHGALIYCDPPYQGTTGYDYADRFDHVEFWEVMRRWSKDNRVFISEYSAPDDFECALEIATRLGIRDKENKRQHRVEKVFRMRR